MTFEAVNKKHIFLQQLPYSGNHKRNKCTFIIIVSHLETSECSVTGVCECRENFFLFKHQVFSFDVNIETIFCPFQVSGVGLQGGE